MSSSLRWRIVLVVVVTVFALALVWPTIRWATLGRDKTETLELAHAKIAGLTPKQILSLKYYRWEAELRDDLEFTRTLLKIRKSEDKEKRRDEIVKERQALRDTLAADTAARKAPEEFKALAPFEQAQALIRLEIKARQPSNASLWRNVRHDVYRWWHGDEDKILRLGLDLQGGIYMVLRTEPKDQAQVYEKLKLRIDQFGVSEPILQKRGRSHIVIQLPGATDREKAERLITERAVMKWMLVEERQLEQLFRDPVALLNLYDATVKELDDSDKDEEGNLVNFAKFDQQIAEAGSIPEGTVLRVLEDTDITGAKRRVPLLLRASEDPPYVIIGDDLTGSSCRESRDSYGRPAVSFQIGTADGKRRFKDTTTRYSAQNEENRIEEGNSTRGWRLAILLDERVVSAPQIAQPLSDSGQITGLENVEEAKMLALQLRTGSLPAHIDIVENRQVGPSLGADSVRMGWRAAIIGLVVVMVFMIIYYRVSGVFAVVALVANLLLLTAALAAAGATLTLPGIAGIVLTIGMAVDGNVLIFERIREELAAAKKLKAAVHAGFDKAVRTILDANITTLIIGVVLFLLGTGPVRGFAVTLSIGICTSVFTAVVVTRVLYDLLLLNKSVERVTMLQFFRNPNFDFIKWRRVALIGSAAVIVIGMIAFGAKFRDNWGTDFTGGTAVRLDFGDQKVETGQVRAALGRLGIPYDRVQGLDTASSAADKVLVQVRGTPEEDERLRDLPAKISTAIGVPLADSSVESISGSVSADLAEKSAVALVLSFLGVLIYVAWRFEFRFALGGVIALVHDVLVAAAFFSGFFILRRRQIDTATMAAFLTIIGYSINDTIVIFDRIREDLKIMKRLDFRTIINTSINQTLSRTILTSLTTLFVVVSLFVLGGESINSFSFAMLVGIIVGSYSTVYIATPILLFMERGRAGAKAG